MYVILLAVILREESSLFECFSPLLAIRHLRVSSRSNRDDWLLGLLHILVEGASRMVWGPRLPM
jgi:hypothetical protein